MRIIVLITFLLIALFSAVSTAMESANSKPKKTECACCISNLSFKEFFLFQFTLTKRLQCPRGHRFCDRCAEQRFYSRQNGNSNFDCFAYGGCTALFNPLHICEMAPNQQIKRVYEQIIDGRRLISCLHCQRGAFLDSDQSKIQCLNDRCLRVTCLKCNEICSSIHRHECNPLNEFREHVSTAMKRLVAQRCPNCFRWVQKTEGCNHMTCVCLAQFCYLCGAEYDSDHFETTPCRQFSVSTISRITLAQVGKEAFENWLRTNDGRLTDSEKKQLRNYEVDPDNLSLRQKKGIMEVIEPHLRLAVCVASAAVVSAMLHYSTSRF